MKLIPIVVLAIAAVRASPAATIDISAGNNTTGDEQNVILNSSGPATTVTGTLSGFRGLLVSFMSVNGGGDLVAPSNGQARIEAASGPLPDVLVSLSGGYTFTDLIFNAFGAGNQNAGTATITATGTSTGPVTPAPLPLSNGQNFFTVRATGDTLASVLISAPGAVDLRQVRLSGVAPGGVVVSAVPEPGTLALLAAGILPFILFRRKKQS